MAKARRRFPGAAVIVLGLALVAALGIWTWKRQHPDGPPPDGLPAETKGTNSGVPFNTLTCVNRHNAPKPLDVYRFLRSEVGSTYMNRTEFNRSKRRKGRRNTDQ